MVNTDLMYTLKVNERRIPIYLTRDSGKPIYRLKKPSPTRVKHTGLIFGNDPSGRTWVFHNHLDSGRPCIVPMDEFRQGQKFYFYRIPIAFSPEERIDRALREIRMGIRYNAIGNNCQSFVERICNGSSRSKDVEDGLRFFGVLGAAFLVIAFANE